MSVQSETPIRVLIVDDSVVFRRFVRGCLTDVPGIEVVGEAENGREALRKINSANPDVMTLDIEMPVLDGIGTIEQLAHCANQPRIIVLSALDLESQKNTVEALRNGAFDFLPKPSANEIGNFKDVLSERTRFAASCAAPAAALPPVEAAVELHGPFDVVGIGSSTGGPAALDTLFRGFTTDFPVPIVIVQHMPAGFTEQMARSLDRVSAIDVCHAEDGMELLPGRAIVAAGDHHLKFRTQDDRTVCRLTGGDLVCGCRPAVDVTFEALAKAFGPNTLSVVMTGMGHDGTNGARRVRQAGGSVLVQEQTTCVVPGMPTSVMDANLHNSVARLDDMSTVITRAVEGGGA